MEWPEQLVAEMRRYYCLQHQERWYVGAGERQGEYIVNCGELVFFLSVSEEVLALDKPQIEGCLRRTLNCPKEAQILVRHGESMRALVGLTVAHEVGHGHYRNKALWRTDAIVADEARAWKYAMQVRQNVPMGALPHMRDCLQSYSRTTWPRTLKLIAEGATYT